MKLGHSSGEIKTRLGRLFARRTIKVVVDATFLNVGVRNKKRSIDVRWLDKDSGELFLR